MKNNYNILIQVILLCFLSNLNLGGQTNAKVFVHTDKVFYVNGDQMQYSLTLPSLTSMSPKAIKTSLISKSSNIIHESYHKSNAQNKITGYINIPLDIQSEVFHLVFSGIDKDSEEIIKIAEIFVPIYSDLQKDFSLSTNNSFEQSAAPSVEFDINIDLNSKNISRRDIIHTEISSIQNEAPSTSISISVRSMDLPFGNYPAVHVFPLAQADIISNLDTTIYLQGNITTQDNTVKRFPVIGIFDKINSDFSYLQTDMEGKFSIPIDQFKGTKSIQFVNYGKGDIKVKFREIPLASNAPSLPINDEIISYLQESRKRKKINSIFGIDEYSKQVETDTSTIKSLVGDKTYITSQYESFENIPIMFVEILSSGLRFKEEKDGLLVAQVFNREQASRGYYPGTPIFIVDGLITKDANLIKELNMNLVDQIDVISNYRRLYDNMGPLGHAGIIYIKTSIPTINLPASIEDDIFTINGFQNSILHNDGQSGLISRTEQTPDFRSSIHWISNLSTYQNGKISFEFQHSDDCGNFLIEVFAHSKEKVNYQTAQYTVTK